MIKQFARPAAALALLLAATSVQATVITAQDSWNNTSTQVVGDVTISALSSPDIAGKIGTKAIPGKNVGAGVVGQGNNEIDAFGSTSEILRFTFGSASVIDILELGLLFDGPEYKDFQEVAGMTVRFADDSVGDFKLTTQYVSSTQTNYLWTGLGSWDTFGIVDGGAGLWTGHNPFGAQGVLQIDFFAINGTCATGLSCNDQSDYVFRSMTTSVPEPGTLALFGIGLLGMSVAARRRKQKV